MHFDKPFYASGEMAWYKLYLPAVMLGKDLSVRATIASSHSGLISEAFLPVQKNGVCQGHFSIPFGARSAMYTVLFSAMRADGTEDELLRAYVPVYSDLGDWSQKTAIEAAPALSPALPSNALKIEIYPATASPVSPGGKVHLQIRVSDEIGHPVAAEGSLSVADDVLCGPGILGATGIQAGAPFSAEGAWLPGLYLSGFVKDPLGRLPSINLIPVLDLEAQQLHFTKSDKGQFILSLPVFEGERRLQMVPFQDEPFQVYWKDSELNLPARQIPPLRYTEGVLRYLDSSRKRKKIYQFYGETENPVSKETSRVTAAEWKTKQTFIVPNYEHFPDLATFFQEVIWRVKFTKKGDRYTAKMYNSDTHANFESPVLFILDQKATYDADFIGRLDQSLIAEIEVLSDPKQLRKLYPAIGGGGVVRIRSITGHVPLPGEKESEIRNIHGILSARTFPDWSEQAAGLPRLGPVVHWQPSFRTDNNGTALLVFTQSDDRSTFCAEVVVQAPDGRRGYARYCYEVK